MNVQLVFIGQAEALAAQYEGVGPHGFAAADLPPGNGRGYVAPGIGDRVRLRMHPGPDIRTFRCTGRLFDFSEAGSPLLQIELDMA